MHRTKSKAEDGPHEKCANLRAPGADIFTGLFCGKEHSKKYVEVQKTPKQRFLTLKNVMRKMH